MVVCQFGAMFFPDRVAAYREVRRVLQPNGTFLFSVWGRLEDNEFDAVATETLAMRYPKSPIDFMAKGPHGYCSRPKIEADLRAAGFQTCELSVVELVSEAANAEQAAHALCGGTPLRGEIEAREPGGLERATTTVAEALQRRFGQGPIQGQMSAIVASTKRQQK
jgi:SAM-dependent methyltransferase